MDKLQEAKREAIKLIQSEFGYAVLDLDEVFEVKRREKKDIFTKKDILDKGRPAIHYGEIARIYDNFTAETISKVSDRLYLKENKLNKNEIVISGEDFSIEHIGRALLYLGKEPALIAGVNFVLKLREEFKEMVDLKYITLWMNYSKTWREQIEKISQGVKVQRLKTNEFYTLKIILAPIEIQKEIFLQLDKLKKMQNKNQDRINIAEKRLKYYYDELFKFRK